MRFRAYHGVLPQERAVGNDFEVSLRLLYPFERAMENDDLSATLNYAAVHEVVRREMAVPSQLIEHVAGRIYRALLKEFPEISGGTITVRKLHPPIPASTASAAVEINW